MHSSKNREYAQIPLMTGEASVAVVQEMLRTLFQECFNRQNVEALGCCNDHFYSWMQGECRGFSCWLQRNETPPYTFDYHRIWRHDQRHVWSIHPFQLSGFVCNERFSTTHGMCTESLCCKGGSVNGCTRSICRCKHGKFYLC